MVPPELIGDNGVATTSAARNGPTNPVDDAKAELKRLREDLTVASRRSGPVAEVVFDSSGLAAIPANVPELPIDFRETSAIKRLRQLLLSSGGRDGKMSVKKVGFWVSLKPA